MNKSEKLTKLIQRVTAGEDPVAIRIENGDFLTTLGMRDVAEAQGRMIESGVSVSDLYSFVKADHAKGIVPDQVDNLKKHLSDNHVLRSLLTEHDYICCLLADLESVCLEIMEMKVIKETSAQYCKLLNISKQLLNIKRHMTFEDDVLFNEVRSKCSLKFVDHVKAEHVYLNIAVQDLYQLAINLTKYKFKDFKRRLSTIEEYLCCIMREHIFVENSILYPIAFEALKKDSVWKYLKDIRDEMGYSIFY